MPVVVLSLLPFCSCSSVSVISDLLLVRDHSGIMGIYHLYTGSLFTAIDGVIVTCLAATNHMVVAAHKHCLHVYHLT